METFKDLILNYGALASFIFLALGFILWGVKSKKTIFKQIFYNLSAIFIALSVYEIYQEVLTIWEPEVKMAGDLNPKEYYGYDELLGYKPRSDSMDVTARKIRGEEIVYDVSYTVRKGRRFTPNNNPESKECIIFLGGSFTFGEGLEDNETLPYYVNTYSNQRYYVKNYGFHGYGPHQALSIVENNLMIDTIIEKAATVQAYYLFISDHVNRVAGNTIWDKNGPYYEIENGEIVKKGSFKDKKDTLNFHSALNMIKGIYLRSHFINKVLKFKQTNSEYEIQKTYLAFNEMNKILKSKGIDFTVIIDSSRMSKSIPQSIKQKLIKNNISILEISDIIENYEEDFLNLYIKNDGHPSKLYNDKIAKYLVEHSPEPLSTKE